QARLAADGHRRRLTATCVGLCDSVYVRDVHREATPLARLRPQLQSMIQERREPLHYGETEADTARAIALRVADLIELLEHQRLLALAHATPRIPYLHAQIGAAPATDEHLAAIGVRDGIGDDVAQDALTKHWITVGYRACRANAQLEPFRSGLPLVVAAHALDQRANRERHTIHVHHARIEPRDIEQPAEESAQRAYRTLDVIDEAARLRVHRMRAQGRDEQAQRMHRLP